MGLLIPGEWKHVAVYVGEMNGVPCVVEALDAGVTLTTLMDFMLTKDRLLVRRPIGFTAEQRVDAARVALEQVGTPYDYHFVYSDEKAWYCSELAYHAYFSINKNWNFTPREMLGEVTICPDDIAYADKKFETIYPPKS